MHSVCARDCNAQPICKWCNVGNSFNFFNNIYNLQVNTVVSSSLFYTIKNVIRVFQNTPSSYVVPFGRDYGKIVRTVCSRHLLEKESDTDCVVPLFCRRCPPLWDGVESDLCTASGRLRLSPSRVTESSWGWCTTSCRYIVPCFFLCRGSILSPFAAIRVGLLFSSPDPTYEIPDSGERTAMSSVGVKNEHISY